MSTRVCSGSLHPNLTTSHFIPSGGLYRHSRPQLCLGSCLSPPVAPLPDGSSLTGAFAASAFDMAPTFMRATAIAFLCFAKLLSLYRTFRIFSFHLNHLPAFTDFSLPSLLLFDNRIAAVESEIVSPFLQARSHSLINRSTTLATLTAHFTPDTITANRPLTKVT